MNSARFQKNVEDFTCEHPDGKRVALSTGQVAAQCV